MSIASQFPSEVPWDFTPNVYQYLSKLLECVYPSTELSEDEFGFDWYGFPEVGPEWLEMGSLVARLTSKRGPIPIRLGDILVPPKGSSRGQLRAIRIDEGTVLSVKGGGGKLLSMLTEHFGVPWLQGISPVPVPKRLSWTPINPEPTVESPVSFKGYLVWKSRFLVLSNRSCSMSCCQSSLTH
ncbi:hypothetical protein BH11VER1_BH11VER1_24340 [soil metagenome]